MCVQVSYFVLSVFPLCYCLVVRTSAIGCLERLVSKIAYCLECNVKRYTLTHSNSVYWRRLADTHALRMLKCNSGL